MTRLSSATRHTPTIGTTDPFLAGNYAPVNDEVTLTELEVRGHLPPQLSGQYIRNGPNPLGDVTTPHHWFSGEGMVHGVTIDAGRVHSYRNRWVRTDSVADALGEPRRSGPAQPLYDVSNTNVIDFAGRMLSLNEGAHPYVLDRTLDTIGRGEFGPTLPHGMTAHPKLDPATGDLHAFSYWWEEPWLLYHRISPEGIVVHTIELDLPAPITMHDFAITENHIVFFDQPAVFDLDAVTTSGFPFRWKPDNGARIGLLPRTGTAEDIRWIATPLGYSFHPLNAFEMHGELIVDLPLLPNAFASDKFESGGDRFLGLQRWTVDIEGGRLTSEVLDATPQEFSRISEHRVGLPYRYGYTVELGPKMPYEQTRVFKHDLHTGNRTVHDFGRGNHPGEFVFVPDPAAAGDEDDGWLIGLVHHERENKTTLAVLDADYITEAPIAEINIPRRIPYGLHGNWFPS